MFKAQDVTLHDVRGMTCSEAIDALQASWDRALDHIDTVRRERFRDSRKVIREAAAAKVRLRTARALEREAKASLRYWRFKRLISR